MIAKFFSQFLLDDRHFWPHHKSEIKKIKLKKKRVRTVVNLPKKKASKTNKCFKIWHIHREFVKNYFLYSFFWGGGVSKFCKKNSYKKKNSCQSVTKTWNRALFFQQDMNHQGQTVSQGHETSGSEGVTLHMRPLVRVRLWQVLNWYNKSYILIHYVCQFVW